jgi:beta-hydroxylase
MDTDNKLTKNNTPSTAVTKKSAKTFRERAYDVAMAILHPMAKVVERTSLVPTTPFLDLATFSWIRRMEDNWRDIRSEMEGMLAYRDALPAFHEINGDATDIRNDDWKSFFFYGFGKRIEANCQRCPKTAALIAQVPGMTTAFFSILLPGARLPPHRGPWKGFLRYHLGLLVPEPAQSCRIVVGGQVAHWQEGRSLLFDDTYEHDVENNTSGIRVVLFMDIVRPCRFWGRLANHLVIRGAALTPFVRDSMGRHKAWERRFAALQGHR